MKFILFLIFVLSFLIAPTSSASSDKIQRAELFYKALHSAKGLQDDKRCEATGRCIVSAEVTCTKEINRFTKNATYFCAYLPK